MSDAALIAATAAEAREAGVDAAAPILSTFEFWPRWLFYFPIIVHWTLLSIRYGSLSLPTAANPAFEAGGLCGESKTDLFATFGPECRERMAPFISVAVPSGPSAEGDVLERALVAMQKAGLKWPVVAKPDIGCQGTGVQLIADRDALARYIAGFPAGERVVLQQWVQQEGEAGVLYIRPPGAPHGSIFSLTLKYFPAITGDGQSSVEELIRADARAGCIAELYLVRLAEERKRVLAAGKRLPLVFTGNHCKGAIFRNGAPYVTAEMTAAFERVARSIARFHFGRFDVRFTSLEDLMRGDFTIIEVNGAGSEATHIWDPATGLIEAYATLFRQYRLLFSIAARNRADGVRPMRVFDLLRLYRRQQRLMASYPPST
ncbi:MAG: D-alanine--D-alanine ligase [Alphaproteobacteria bacterium]|nr:D-alanine--D-alanine ligase [Alphaproteobacteria bacterium]